MTTIIKKSSTVGRPKSDAEYVHISNLISVKEYESLQKEAKAEFVSMSTIVRRLLRSLDNASTSGE